MSDDEIILFASEITGGLFAAGEPAPGSFRYLEADWTLQAADPHDDDAPTLATFEAVYTAGERTLVVLLGV